MTSSLGFNKAESANFIFECVQYLMPEEGGGVRWGGGPFLFRVVKQCKSPLYFFLFVYFFLRWDKCRSTLANEGLWKSLPTKFRCLCSFSNLKTAKKWNKYIGIKKKKIWLCVTVVQHDAEVWNDMRTGLSSAKSSECRSSVRNDFTFLSEMSTSNTLQGPECEIWRKNS